MATVIEEYQRRLAEDPEIVASAKRAGVPAPPPNTGSRIGDAILAFERKMRAKREAEAGD
jgi:hypothetical protein